MMGYGEPALEEISDNRLTDELESRARKRAEGLCSYCGKPAQVKPGCAARDHHMTRTRGITPTAIDTVINDVRYILGVKK